MNGLTLLAGATALAAAWTMRALYLDMRRAQRRADRLAARNAELRAALGDAEADLQLWSELHLAAAKDRHPSGRGHVRLIRDEA